MFKSKSLLLGIALALVLSMFNVVPLAVADSDVKNEVELSELPEDVLDGVVAYRTKDGGKSWIPVYEEKGVAERIPSGMTRAEFMERYAPSPEAEAAIIHETPPCFVIIDGVLYEPEQIHLFDGQRLGFTVGNNGRLYAFTTDEALVKFRQEQDKLAGKETPRAESKIRSDYSFFYEDTYYSGDMQLAALPGVTVPDLSDVGGDDYDNIFSSEKINSAATSATLFDDYDYWGDYFDRPGGNNYPDLGDYGWSDKASSLIVWWF